MQRFVNSYDHLTEHGIIETPDALDAWISARGLPEGKRATAADVRRVRNFRETLRAVLGGNNGGPVDPIVIEKMNTLIRKAMLAVHVQPDGRPALKGDGRGVPGLLGAIGAALATAEARGIWERLKACHSCGWIFYDRSKNRSGSWCTMTICGSRSKMRAYRNRNRPPVN
ncbi:MAG: CGNR zinc finger domain-containing protein [Actinomycetota bacterium]|nr:CGNR zinc finger domain-containing protein [Actinomycetota bacterium]